MLIFYTNSQTFRSLAVDFCMKKELRTNYLVRQPLFFAWGFTEVLFSDIIKSIFVAFCAIIWIK